VFVHKVVHSLSVSPKALTNSTKVRSTDAGGTDAAGPNGFAHVLLDIPVPHALQYRLAPDQQSITRVGMRCVAPVGPGRLMLGIVAGLSSECSLEERRVRTLHTLLDDPTLSQEWLQFCKFAAEYYHHPWAQVALGALPPSLRRIPGPRAAARLARVRRAPPAPAAVDPAEPPPLREEQRQAIDAIAQARGFAPFLLHGITGSGKTEVYLGALAAALGSDPQAQALWLVPEINLTPQFEARLQRRFAHVHVVSLHSGLGTVERTAAWLAAHEGRARIVLGTRLAVFASLPHLRIVIVDEEHDTSFKASDGVRYSARDLAVKRAQLGRTAVVLGSATPSLESWHQTLSGRYTMLRLRQRVAGVGHPSGAPLAGPRVQTVDIRQHPPQQGLSAPLRDALGEGLQRREQALVFINRRGYAPVLTCEACGWLSDCPNCSAYAALHRGERVIALSSLRLAAPGAARLPDLWQPGSEAGRAGYTAGRGDAAPELASSAHRASGPRQRAADKQRGARAAAGSLGRARRAGRHANDHQRARLSQRVGRVCTQCGCATDRGRFSRPGAPVRAADAGGRARRPSRPGIERSGADPLSRPSALPCFSEGRLRGVRS
jgi:hypothetical protein